MDYLEKRRRLEDSYRAVTESGGDAPTLIVEALQYAELDPEKVGAVREAIAKLLNGYKHSGKKI